MPIISQIIICSLAGGVFSLVGGIALLASKKSIILTKYATVFAAGTLLAAAFVDILPEATHDSDSKTTLIFTLIGILVFFVLEILLNQFHKHGSNNDTTVSKAVAPMIIIGDTLHNFIDGLAIATGFLVSPTTGIVVTIAVALHEIPQEIGDFGLLLSSGIKKKKVILVNILSSFATTIGAIIFFLIGSNFETSLTPLLGLVAGFFIYIAASDIIPTIHADKSRRSKMIKMLWVIVGVIVVSLAILTVHDFTNNYNANNQESTLIENHPRIH